MVRTRTHRRSGGGSPGRDNSASLKPQCGPNRGRGRKRGLAEGREEGAEGQALSVTSQQCLELTQSAALSPVAGPGPGQGPATHLQGPALARLQEGPDLAGPAPEAAPPAPGWVPGPGRGEQGCLAPALGSSLGGPGGEGGGAVEEQALSEPGAGQGPAEGGPQPAADLVLFRETGSPGEAGPGGAGPSLALPEDLKANLECPVCARISLPPILQCRNGHVTCNPCRLKVQSCPMCREIDIDIRNLFAEKAVTFMSIPCEFRQFGCRVEVQYKEKEAHERACKFRPYICPYIECDHKLAADAVVMHVSTAHREECRRSDGPEITASMILIGQFFGGDGAWSPRVITCFGRTFFDVALTRDRWLHHWVWLLGEEEEAAHYTYEITAFKGNTKYVYGSEVASLRTSDDEIVSEGKCLSISDAIGRRLRDGDKIRYKLKLMRK